MKNLLIVADNPYWFGRAAEAACGFGRDKIDVGVSAKIFDDPVALMEINQATRASRAWGYEPRRISIHDPMLSRQYQVIFSAHCQTIFPKSLLDETPCYNLHPGLLPQDRGWHPVTWAKLRGNHAGATLHRMYPAVDAGPVLDEGTVHMALHHTCFDLLMAVRRVEQELFDRWLPCMVSGAIVGMKEAEQEWVGEPKTKKDLAAIVKLDLDEKLTMREAITRLAALTYAKDKSAAYFEDEGVKHNIGIFTYEKPDD